MLTIEEQSQMERISESIESEQPSTYISTGHI